jgi:hypothetical protein
MSNELQHKMYNYEVQPPVESWNRIVAALGEEVTLAERLKKFEAVPPATVWNKIETELGTETKVISFRRKNFIRYAAAAILFALIVLSGTFLLKNNGNNDTAPQSNPTNINTTLTDSDGSSTQSSTVTNERDLAHNTADRQIAYNHKPKRLSVSKFVSRLQQINAPEKIEPERKISFDNTVDRYMIYSDGDGNAMRLPKKLYDAISCVQFDISCKDRMQGLQQKIANASVTSDFTAVLEMLNNLRENQ